MGVREELKGDLEPTVADPSPRGSEKGTVRLESVSKTYPGAHVPAVADASMAIQSGEFFSILGPSGSGKTTTLRLIAGFERPNSGEVYLSGRAVTHLAPHKRPVHTVFQNYALFPHLNVAQNIAYPLKMRRLPRPEIARRIQLVLERMSLGAFEKRMPHQLSGGQRQRVALARALVGEPEVVLLDEPLGALDLKLRQEMQLVLQHLQREVGITFVYVTHDQGEALAMSDRIAIITEGVVHQIGSPDEIYSKPSTAFVAGFVGKTNLLRCTVVGGTELLASELRFHVHEPPKGEHCIVSLRPEALSLGPDAGGRTNRVEGFVEEAIYQGADVELRLRVAGHSFIARAPVGCHHVGESIQIGWEPQAAIVVDEQPGHSEGAS
jgi:spermidine/putrescine transport system ATP-binding protein